MDEVSKKIDEQFQLFDTKLVRLRHEIDINAIMRLIDRKANED
jgi:hypothetical protein